MTDKRSAADILRQQEATLEAVNPRLAAKCEECGAGMTYVDISDDAVRGWFDHTPDCSHVDTAGVFTLDAASVRNRGDIPADELVAIAEEARATVEAEAIPEDLLEEFCAKVPVAGMVPVAEGRCDLGQHHRRRRPDQCHHHRDVGCDETHQRRNPGGSDDRRVGAHVGDQHRQRPRAALAACCFCSLSWPSARKSLGVCAAPGIAVRRDRDESRLCW